MMDSLVSPTGGLSETANIILEAVRLRPIRPLL